MLKGLSVSRLEGPAGQLSVTKSLQLGQQREDPEAMYSMFNLFFFFNFDIYYFIHYGCSWGI